MLALFLASALAVQRPQTYRARVIQTPVESGVACELTDFGWGQMRKEALVLPKDKVFVTRMPAELAEGHSHSEVAEQARQKELVTVFGQTEAAVFGWVKENCAEFSSSAINFFPEEPEREIAYEVRKLVDSGPPENRIDVVFMGDGYTESQRDLFFADIERMVNDMFSEVTFKSYLPVFNIWAVYEPSNEEGIGYYSTPKDTAYGLYRDGTELRGVYCSKPVAARQACAQTGPDACDFPSLIGNDPYYGGLGGEFTISTSSLTSGTKVLRHEMGHNFASVGEEYHGGSAYFGANFASSLASLGWRHWLTEPDNLRAEEMALRVQDYAWYDLAEGPYNITFSSNGAYSRRMLRFTASGVEVEGSLEVSLDGVYFPWNTTGDLDRGFHEYYTPSGFTSGSHRLTFASGFPPDTDNIRQLCSVTYEEYMPEPRYRYNNDFIGAYPVYRSNGQQAGFRPNHEQCLMRNMSSEIFCVVCQETMWHQFFAVMSTIDDVIVTYEGTNVRVFLDAVELGQLRPVQIPGERYIVTWYRNNVLQSALSDQFEWTLPRSSASGSWRVQVVFETEEVRSDPNGLLTNSQTFSISA